jgi:hypothetical protein
MIHTEMLQRLTGWSRLLLQGPSAANAAAQGPALINIVLQGPSAANAAAQGPALINIVLQGPSAVNAAAQGPARRTLPTAQKELS